MRLIDNIPIRILRIQSNSSDHVFNWKCVVLLSAHNFGQMTFSVIMSRNRVAVGQMSCALKPCFTPSMWSFWIFECPRWELSSHQKWRYVGFKDIAKAPKKGVDIIITLFISAILENFKPYSHKVIFKILMEGWYTCNSNLGFSIFVKKLKKL